MSEAENIAKNMSNMKDAERLKPLVDSMEYWAEKVSDTNLLKGWRLESSYKLIEAAEKVKAELAKQAK